MERGANYPTPHDVRAAIREQHRKRVAVDNNGYARPYAAQSADYRSLVSQADHDRAHGTGYRASDHVGRDQAGSRGDV